MGNQARSKFHSGLDSFVNRKKVTAKVLFKFVYIYMQTNPKEDIKIVQ